MTNNADSLTGDSTANDRVVITLADLAYGIVCVEAPDQLELLTEVTTRWETGAEPTRKRSGSLSGSVGCGIEPVVLSELVYPLLVGTVAHVLGTASVASWRRKWWRKWWPGRRAVPSVPQTMVMLDAKQIEDFRAACVIHAMALGFTKRKANVLADALCGVLLRTLAESANVSRDDG